MLKSFFVTALRHLNRNRKHALLNIAGLGVALAACLIIFLVIQFEYSHNSNFRNRDQIFQVATLDVDQEGEHYTGGVPFPLINHLRQDYPQFLFGRFMQNYGAQVTVRKQGNGKVNDDKYLENMGLFFAEPEIATIFELQFLAGTAQALKGVDQVVLSQKWATRYFGSWQKAIGKRLNLDNEPYDLTMAAVFEDLPDNCDFPFQMLASFASFEAHNSTGWPLNDWGSITSNHQVFTLLPPGTNAEAFSKLLKHIEKKYNPENKENSRQHFLNPLAKLHFEERYSASGDHTAKWSYLYTLASIGILILVMACINFVNLSTALAVSRSREVGVRKVMGGTRGQVRMQVLVETTVVVLVAALLGIFLAWLTLPYLKNVVVIQTQLVLFQPSVFAYLLSVAACTILLSGFYPALVMGAFPPVEAIKNTLQARTVGNISLRRALVIIQFAFSQVFIIATIIAIYQMDYIQNADLGFKKEGILLLHGSSDSASRSRFAAFKNELLARPDVKKVSLSFDAPSSTNSWQTNFAFETTQDRDFSLGIKVADEDYVSTYGLQLLAGRSFGPGDTAKEYMVNETFLKKVGVKDPQEAIGKRIRLGGNSFKPICGVLKDFHTQSFRENIPPLAIFPNKRHMGLTGIFLSSNHLGQSSKEIQTLWDRYFPEYVYNAEFLDESVARFYKQEERTRLLYKVYALLAIFISCLGLYGLISFIVVQKTRELGIRKVLGASVQSLVLLLSREFTLLIGIAFIIAAPVAWYAMHLWLQDFAYKVTIGPQVYLLGLLVSAVVAWLTVGYKSFQAAMANPIRNLRTE